MKLPDIWGEGILCAYSGVDGTTDWHYPFIATTLSSPGSLLFHLNPARRLFFPVPAEGMARAEIVSSDFVSFKRPALQFLFMDKDTLIGESFYIPEIVCDGSIREKKEDCRVLQSAAGSHTVLVWKKGRNGVRFAYAFDPDSIRNATVKAAGGITADLAKEREKKMDFFRNLPRPRLGEALAEKTYYKACSVMKVNVESAQGRIPYTWTTPDRIPHRDMWLWDSAFHSLSNHVISPSLAEDTIKAVLALQRKDGFVAHQMNPQKGRVSQVTQPPILAWAAYRLFQRTGNRAFLEYVYPRITKQIRWLYKNRDDDRSGLLEWHIHPGAVCKCGECGMDNSPRFDHLQAGERMKAIDLNCFAVDEMEYLAAMAEKLGKKKDAVFWKQERELKAKLVNDRLWDGKDRFYYDLNKDGTFNRVKTPASFLPLFAGIADREKADALLKHLTNPKEFLTVFPVPSTAIDEPSYCKDMWRGPTWVNYNYFVIEGLRRYGFDKPARCMAMRTLDEISRWYGRTGVIFEYYDTEAEDFPGQLPRKVWLGGPGMKVINDYHWTAAVYVALLFEINGIHR